MKTNQYLNYKYREVKESSNSKIEETKEVKTTNLENVDTIIDNNDSLIADYSLDENIKNIEDIDQLANIINQILLISWGRDWGELVPCYIEDETNPTFPKIVYDVNARELSDHSGKKPMLYSYEKEVIDGKETGDGFGIYRQWYDTVIEFNFYGTTIRECRELMIRFEKTMMSYIGLIKSQGLSEMIYLEEIPTEKSMKYKPGIPMKSNAYYVRFEHIQKVRMSILKQIEYSINKEIYGEL